MERNPTLEDYDAEIKRYVMAPAALDPNPNPSPHPSPNPSPSPNPNPSSLPSP